LEDFIQTHLHVLAATDFFTAEVLTLKGLSPTMSSSSSI